MTYNTEKHPESLALSFISSGVACFALMYLDQIGVLDQLLASGTWQFNALEEDLGLERAFLELELNGLIIKEEKNYLLTSLGAEVANYAGLMHYIYRGYCNVLSSPKESVKIDHQSVVRGSNLLGEKFIDHAILNALKGFVIDNTICDLGCGDGNRLAKICKTFKCNGLGLELNSSDLSNASNQEDKSVRIQDADITNLHEIWDEVSGLIQVMVMHDFTPERRCVKIIDSFRTHFPNLRFFLYCDIVAPSQDMKTQLPGFDYIHALLGVKTRTYEETLEVFNQSKFDINNEIKIEKMPNTYLWVLIPK